MGDTVFDPVERAAEAIVGRLEYLGRITPSWRYDYLADARELARVVVDALGLTEEWNVQTDGRPHLEPMEGPPSDVMRERLAAINSKSEYHRTFVSRLVTPWEEQ